MITTIKIGRKEYPINSGDYILDNGACLQFCAGNARTIHQEGFNCYTSLRIAEKYRAILSGMRLVRQQGMKYYYF